MKDFASKGLKKQIARFQEKAHTGCISITEQSNGKRTYGLLQFHQGELTAAKYGSLKGQDAVDAIKKVNSPILSFAKGKLLEEDSSPITLESRPTAKAGQVTGWTIRWVDRIETKVSFFLVLITTLLLIGFGAYNVYNSRTNLVESLTTLADTSSEQLSINLALPLWNLDKETIANAIEAEMSDSRIQAIIVRDEDGQSIFASKQRNGEWSIVDAEGEVANPEGLTLTVAKKEVSSPQGDSVIGTAEVYATPRFIQEELQRSIFAELLRVIILDIAIILAVALVLRRLLIRPVVSLTQSAEELSIGKSAHISVNSNDEIGRLAQAFERLRISLDVAMKHIG